MRKSFVALAAFFFISCSLLAQAPNPTLSIRNFSQLRTFLSSSAFTRVVTVDKTAGVGDFITIKAACDYVALQVRSSTAQWLIRVYPGVYAEVPFTVPTYTIVEAAYHTVANPFGQQITVTSTVATGTFITLNGSWNGLNIEHSATLTAPTILFQVSSNASISNTSVFTFASTATHAMSFVDTDAAAIGVWLYYCYFTTGGSGTNLTMYNQDSSGTSYIIDTIFSAQDTTLNGVKINAGTLVMARSKVGSLYQPAQFTNGINNAGGTVYVNDTQYHSATGTINDTLDRPKVRRIVDTLPATCVDGDIVGDLGTVKRFCVCVAANTWNCAALAAP